MTGHETDVTRRRVLQAGAAASTISVAGCAGSDDGGEFPQRDVEIVVPFSTGGGFDAYARISQPYWERQLGDDATVVVSNIEGAGGRTGATRVYNDGDDPHRMLFWYPSAALPPQIVREEDYDVTEMRPIGAMARDPNAVVVRDDAGVGSLVELGEAAADLRFGTQGVGSAAHTVSLILGATTDLVDPAELNFVHYDGTGEAQNGLNSGEIDAMIVGTASSAAGLHDAIDAVSMLTVFGTPEEGSRYADRTAEFSAEVGGVDGLAEYAALTQFVRMLVAPPGVADEPLGTLRGAFDDIVDDEAFRAEADDRNRPIVNPGDHEVVREILEDRLSVYSEEPLLSAFQESLG